MRGKKKSLQTIRFQSCKIKAIFSARKIYECLHIKCWKCWAFFFFFFLTYILSRCNFLLWTSLKVAAVFKKNLKESLGCWGLCEGGWCVKYYKASLNCSTVSTLCLAWVASRGSRSWTLLVPFADSKWKCCCEMGWMGHGKPLSKSEQCFFTNLSCWVQPGERSMGYPTIALLVLDLFQSFSVRYYTNLRESVNWKIVLCRAWASVFSFQYFKQATGICGISFLINR